MLYQQKRVFKLKNKKAGLMEIFGGNKVPVESKDMQLKRYIDSVNKTPSLNGTDGMQQENFMRHNYLDYFSRGVQNDFSNGMPVDFSKKVEVLNNMPANAQAQGQGQGFLDGYLSDIKAVGGYARDRASDAVSGVRDNIVVHGRQAASNINNMLQSAKGNANGFKNNLIDRRDAAAEKAFNYINRGHEVYSPEELAKVNVMYDKGYNPNINIVNVPGGQKIMNGFDPTIVSTGYDKGYVPNGQSSTVPYQAATATKPVDLEAWKARELGPGGVRGFLEDNQWRLGDPESLGIGAAGLAGAGLLGYGAYRAMRPKRKVAGKHFGKNDANKIIDEKQKIASGGNVKMKEREYARIKIAASMGNIEAQNVVMAVEGTGISGIVKAAFAGDASCDEFLGNFESVFGEGSVKMAFDTEQARMSKEAGFMDSIFHRDQMPVPQTDEEAYAMREYFSHPENQTYMQPGVGEVYHDQAYGNGQDIQETARNLIAEHPYYAAAATAAAGFGAGALAARGMNAHRAKADRMLPMRKVAGVTDGVNEFMANRDADMRNMYNPNGYGQGLANYFNGVHIPQTDEEAYAMREYFSHPENQTYMQPGVGDVYNTSYGHDTMGEAGNVMAEHPYAAAAAGLAGLGTAGYGAYRGYKALRNR